MADNVEKLILDDTQFIKALEAILSKIEKLDKSFNDLNNDIAKNSKKSSQEFVKNNKKVNDSLAKTSEAQRKAAENTKENIKGIKLFGVSLGDVSDKLKAYRDGLTTTFLSLGKLTKLTKTQSKGVDRLTKTLGGGRAAFTLLAKSVNFLKVALIASGIGAALVVIGSLAAAVTSSQQGMDKLGQATSYIGGSFDVLTDKAAALGNELINGLGNGTFWETLGTNIKSVFDKGLITSIIEVGTEMNEVGNISANLEKGLQSIRREEKELEVQSAQSAARIKELNLIGEDRTKGLKVQTAAIKAAISIEQGQIETRLQNSKLELALIREKNSLTESTDADLQKEYDLEIKIANLQAASYEKQVELNNKVNALVKEYNDKLAAAGVRLLGITKEVIKIGTEVNLINERDAFEFAKEEQIESLKKLKNELKEISQLTGDDITSQLVILDDAIKGIANTEFVPDIEQLPTKLNKAIKSIDSDNVPSLGLKIEINEESQKAFLEDIDTFEDLFNLALDSIFSDKNQEKAKEFLSNLGDLFSNFNDIINESTELQIQAIDKELEKLGEKREELEKELEKEVADQEKGLANSVENKQEEVDAILSEETRLNQEKEKIQAEAAQRQLALDTFAQTQSIITSSINIIKGFSQIPIFGLPLGIAAVGSMLAFFAKTKVDAFKATKLYKGAERIDDHFGFGERYGDTDLPGRGDGYELVSRRTGKKTNTVISGREMILPENVSISNEEFFHSMRNGLYSGIDLNSAMQFYINHSGLGSKESLSTSNTPVIIQNKQKPQKIKQYIPFTTKKGENKAVLVTIDPNDRDGSIIDL